MGRRIWQVEIRVSDLERAIAFYRGVFDWLITPVGDGYAMIDTGRAPIMSLWAVGESGMPLGVCHYVQSDDCEADAARAEAHGGRIAVDRTEVTGAGAWTDTLDPWNSELAFWQADAPGEPSFSGSGANPLTWVELGAADWARAASYYGQLVGWMFEPVAGVDEYGVYTDHQPGIGLVGGERGTRLRGMTDYIVVADLAAACAAVAAGGGEVLGDAVDLGDGSLFTLFHDPDQNRFGIVQRSQA